MKQNKRRYVKTDEIQSISLLVECNRKSSQFANFIQHYEHLILKLISIQYRLSNKLCRKLKIITVDYIHHQLKNLFMAVKSI